MAEPSELTAGDEENPPTIVSESQVERSDRTVGPDAPRRDRLFAAASAKGVPLRTILTVDAVVIVTWVLYRLLGRLREVILWILIAAFVALVLNPAVAALQRRRFRRGSAVAAVFATAVLIFAGLLALFGYPLVNSLTHVAEQLPTMVDQVQKGHGWLAHTLQHFGLLDWVQKNAPKLKQAAHNLGKPALSIGANVSKAVVSTFVALSTIAFLSLFMLLEAPNLKRSLLNNMNPKARVTVSEIAATVSRSVTAYVLGSIAMGLHVRTGDLRHHGHPRGPLRPADRTVGVPGGHDPAGRAASWPACRRWCWPCSTRRRPGWSPWACSSDSSWSRTTSSTRW